MDWWADECSDGRLGGRADARADRGGQVLSLPGAREGGRLAGRVLVWTSAQVGVCSGGRVFGWMALLKFFPPKCRLSRLTVQLECTFLHTRNRVQKAKSSRSIS